MAADATGTSTKHLAISKANAQMVAAVGIASFVVVFCLIAGKSVWSQTRYQARVTTASEKAKQQLTKNINAFNTLENSYERFDTANPNIIGGNSNSATGNNVGDNAAIILHSLPDTYDFPALASSLEKVLETGSFNVTSISGTDDQLTQQSNTLSSNPQPVSIPFSFTVINASYASVQQLINTLQASIRPIQIDTMNLSGGTNDMSLTIDAHTYYQPAKSLSITKKVIK